MPSEIRRRTRKKSGRAKKTDQSIFGQLHSAGMGKAGQPGGKRSSNHLLGPAAHFQRQLLPHFQFFTRCVQCSLDALIQLEDAAQSGGPASSCSPAGAAASLSNEDLIARLSGCLDDEDPSPPPATKSPGSNAPSVQPPPVSVSALEPIAAPLTPAQMQTSSKIFSSWKDFSPYRMRSVIIPNQAIDAFMFAARANTARNIETCAILGGVQSGDSLVISTVIVPQQKGNR